MNPCRREADVLRAAREDQWSDGLRNHLAECDDCAMTATVAPWMTSFAKIEDRTRRLPDPSIVWLKAKLLQGTIDAERVARPMNIAQLIAYMVVAAGWATVLTWKWEAVQKWMAGFTQTSGTITTTNTLSLSFFGVVFVLASMTVMMVLHTILAEE